MNKTITFTLLADGPSDKALIPIIEWLIDSNITDCTIYSSFSDFRHLRTVPRGLSDRILSAITLYPCDILFIHRDAEREDPSNRVKEINFAIERLKGINIPKHICVIPVRMQESWLLINETAIRKASGNPNGTIPLDLPRIRTIEDIPDPKQYLDTLLKSACGLKGRRKRDLNVAHCRERISQYIHDYSPLRQLPAFVAVEESFRAAAIGLGWHKE